MSRGEIKKITANEKVETAGFSINLPPVDSSPTIVAAPPEPVRQSSNLWLGFKPAELLVMAGASVFVLVAVQLIRDLFKASTWRPITSDFQ